MSNSTGPYLGEKPVAVASHPVYRKYKPHDWALLWLEMFGQFDGGHHKAWVLDQIAQILHGTPVKLSLAQWEGGHEEMRYSLGKPSKAYLEWREAMKGDIDQETGEYEYDYDEGKAP